MANPFKNFKAHKKRANKAWQERAHWQKLYDDAYEFIIPYRRPASRAGKGVNRVERLFDNTAIVSAFRAAGKLHQNLFPSGQQSFRLTPGPIGKLQFKGRETEVARELEAVSEVVAAFFLLPEFDMASNEMCIDLLVGTAALMPLPGNARAPVRFACIPFDEVAIECDGFGAVVMISWKTKFTRRQIEAEWPDADYSADFKQKLENDADAEEEIYQDFCVDTETGRWHFAAYMSDAEKAFIEEEYRTQPVAVPRYYRVPGEPYGRGPALLSLPTVKTVNKAVELFLKGAAIAMLGIWGYRPGGSFNPDTARLAPGQFWPMTSTGGVLGPDVSRLDTAAGRLDVGQLLTQELRLQIQAALHDESLPEQGGTPPSATEVIERVKRVAQNYVGAYGRLVNEIHPVLVRRIMEILYDQKMLETEIEIDTLLIKIDVLSPIATALKTQAISVIIDWIEIVLSIKGEQGMELLAKIDDALRHIGREMGVPPAFIMTEDEAKALEQRIQAAVEAALAAQAASAAA